jgi:glycosyltransferase involved in cell wall biosynthesis
MKHKVLFDLSSAFHGFAGIPQDTRTIFLALCKLKNIDLTGLLCGVDSAVAFHQFAPANQDELTRVYSYGNFLLELRDEYMRHQGITDNEFRGLLRKSLDFVNVVKRRFKSIAYVLKKNYELYPHEKQFDDFIWKTCFADCVDYDFKDDILKQHFVATNFTKYYLKKRIERKMSPVNLKTDDFDFAIFQDGVPAAPNLSPNTLPIVRFHDVVPLLFPDTIRNSRAVAGLFYKSLNQLNEKAVLVCNSAPTRDELLKFLPALEKRTYVIPPVVLGKQIKASGHSVSRIMATYISSFARNVGFDAKNKFDSMNYIVSASTLEPRKNFISLIQAWEKISLEHEDLKLVIVGSPGWKCEPVLNAMRPHIARGNIFHLEKVPLDDLRIIYSNAKAFVFPTLYEGFGSTPVEAMQSGCPVITSDIPVMRWVLGDAALYCKPDDVRSITTTIQELLYSHDSAGLIDRMVQQGYKQAEKYSLEAISKEWGQLFEILKK